MNIIKWLCKEILFLWSYSPIFCLSDDSNFGSNEKGIVDFINRMRFSFFSFSIGEYIFYFISFKKNDKFRVIYRLNLNDYYFFSDTDKQRVSNEQDEYLLQNMNNNIEVDEEFLRYLYDNESNRKNIAYNKINSYTTIILAIIPLILLFFKKEIFVNSSIVIKVLILILLYILFNITAFILQSNKVNENMRFRYSEIKNSSYKRKKKIKAYYMDWQHIKRESNKIVAFVKNIEIYIKGAIIVSVLIAIFNGIGYTNEHKYKSYNNSISEISLNKLEKSDNATLKKLNEINEEITEEKIGKIIIIYNDEKILENSSFNAIWNYFNIFNVKVEKVYDEEEETKDDNIKILLVGE